MKIIIIILICLFFSLSIPNINEFLTDPTGAQQLTTTTTTGAQQPTTASGQSTQTEQTAQPAQPAQPAQQDGGLQSQLNILSTQITTTNAIAVEAKTKVDAISSQIDQLKAELQKAPTD
jgi:hypothetical protein